MNDTNFYKLKVIGIKSETEYAKVIQFDIPDELQEAFTYKSGQYLTLKLNISGKEERRAYSLCSSPVTDKIPQIGVKRVKGGKVSNFVNTILKEGDVIEVMPPQGKFIVDPQAETKKDYYLFGGGSGITPLLSIMKTVVESEPKSRVLLYYQNKNEDSIMFKDVIDEWERKYKGQIIVRYILDEPKTEKKGGVFGLFAQKIVHWNGEIGRIDTVKTKDFVQSNRLGDLRKELFYLCGPEGMMNTIENSLKSMGVDSENIYREAFVSSTKSDAAVNSAGGAHVTATISGKKFEFTLQAKETILEALIRVQADPPFSCMSGACSTCMAKVIEGQVKMERCLALDDHEVEKGFILTCSAIPTTERVEITYDV